MKVKIRPIKIRPITFWLLIVRLVGLLALFADAYFCFVIGAVMYLHNPTAANILLSSAIVTRLAFLVEEAIVTHFDWRAYTVATFIAFSNFVLIIMCESLEAAAVITMATGMGLMFIPIAIKTW